MVPKVVTSKLLEEAALGGQSLVNLWTDKAFGLVHVMNDPIAIHMSSEGIIHSHD